VLILAGEFAAREVNKVAPDVVGGEFVQGMDAFRFTPTDEKGEFDVVKFAGGGGQTTSFAVQQKHVERVGKKMSP
jgi:hypothetical protein